MHTKGFTWGIPVIVHMHMHILLAVLCYMYMYMWHGSGDSELCNNIITRKMISSGGMSLGSWHQLYSKILFVKNQSVIKIPWF